MRTTRSARSARFSLIIRLCQQSNQTTIGQQKTGMKLERFGDALWRQPPLPPRIISILAFPLPSEKENLNTNLNSWFFCLIRGHFPLTALVENLPMISWWQVCTDTQSTVGKGMKDDDVSSRSFVNVLDSGSRHPRARLGRSCDCCVHTRACSCKRICLNNCDYVTNNVVIYPDSELD